MLRDERLMALNDVIVACTEAAEGHASAVGLVEEPELARVLRALAEQREAAANELGEQVRKLGELPKVPDSDLSALREMAERVSEALSFDERATLLDEREHAEATLEEAIAAALAHELPAPARELLVRLQDDARLARERLLSWRERPGDG